MKLAREEYYSRKYCFRCLKCLITSQTPLLKGTRPRIQVYIYIYIYIYIYTYTSTTLVGEGSKYATLPPFNFCPRESKIYWVSRKEHESAVMVAAGGCIKIFRKEHFFYYISAVNP